MQINKPYLIIPKLIQQPTWGGDYIVKLKKFESLPFMGQYKIGQSYELFSGTKLFIAGNSTSHEQFMPEIGFADHNEIVKEHFPLKEKNEYVLLTDMVREDANNMLGPKVLSEFGSMPLLIKINHAQGNSFQLHIKPGMKNDRWLPKPESWYYLEKGLLTCGLNPKSSVSEYKKVCLAIDGFMHDLSVSVVDKKIQIDEARIKAKEYIQSANPWQFVNTYQAEQFDVFDMSAGGLHHSWEENAKILPLGNVIYEVQQDRMDPVSTIRAFDQGKMKDNGSIREINIEDYFTYLDTSVETNAMENVSKKMNGATAMSTKYYAMDVLEVTQNKTVKLIDSFQHLFVREGEITITTDGGMVRMTRGSSCFVPWGCKEYEITSLTGTACVLKTYIGAST
jgi:mannose-6-phosphate isomerase class I